MKNYIFQNKAALAFFFGIGVLANNLCWAIPETGKKKTLVLEDVLKIEGTVEKPEAYFILQHRNFDSLLNAQTAPTFDAVSQIVEAVSSDIF